MQPAVYEVKQFCLNVGYGRCDSDKKLTKGKRKIDSRENGKGGMKSRKGEQENMWYCNLGKMIVVIEYKFAQR